MADLRVASRYVKSLLGLAVERGMLEEVHKDMLLFSKTCKENRGFVAMLRSPVIRHENKKEILRRLFSGKVNKMTMSIFDIITRKNREPLLPSIANEFHNAYNEHMGIGKAEVISSVPLEKDLVEIIEGIARKLSGKPKMELHVKVNPELIGGFILNVGDRQVDASIRSQMKTLDLKFQENYFIKQI